MKMSREDRFSRIAKDRVQRTFILRGADHCRVVRTSRGSIERELQGETAESRESCGAHTTMRVGDGGCFAQEPAALPPHEHLLAGDTIMLS